MQKSKTSETENHTGLYINFPKCVIVHNALDLESVRSVEEKLQNELIRFPLWVLFGTKSHSVQRSLLRRRFDREMAESITEEQIQRVLAPAIDYIRKEGHTQQ